MIDVGMTTARKATLIMPPSMYRMKCQEPPGLLLLHGGKSWTNEQDLCVKHLVFILGLSGAVTFAAQSQQPPPAAFQIEETTIAQIHAAMRAGRLTCRGLVVEQDLKRIETYDKTGPAIGADRGGESRCAGTGRRHGLPRTSGHAAIGFHSTYWLFSGLLFLHPHHRQGQFRDDWPGQTTLSVRSRSRGFVPSRDAFQVKRIKEAGAIVLAKSNMAEFAFTPYRPSARFFPATRGIRTHSIALPPDRAAAPLQPLRRTSARLPGKRHGQLHPVTGITSGAGRHPLDDGADECRGVAPLNLLADIAGPMTRTLEDAVIVLQVIAGPDPDDPVTVTRHADCA